MVLLQVQNANSEDDSDAEIMKDALVVGKATKMGGKDDHDSNSSLKKVRKKSVRSV